MDLVTLDEGVIDFLNDSCIESPEELLTRIEDELDSGELSINEAITYLTDLGLMQRSNKP